MVAIHICEECNKTEYCEYCLNPDSANCANTGEIISIDEIWAQKYIIFYCSNCMDKMEIDQ